MAPFASFGDCMRFYAVDGSEAGVREIIRRLKVQVENDRHLIWVFSASAVGSDCRGAAVRGYEHGSETFFEAPAFAPRREAILELSLPF